MTTTKDMLMSTAKDKLKKPNEFRL